jgi:diguanylate cyclase (GGDEF)-like protein/PAS domain S-box-containing protein
LRKKYRILFLTDNMFKFTVIAVLLFITTAINVIASVISWRRAKSRFSFYFAIGMTGITLWTLASGLDYASVPIPLKIFFTKWEYIFYHVALVFFLMFMLSYAGYAHLVENKIIRAALGVIAGSNILLAWTNDWTNWLWNGFIPSEFGNNTVTFEHGPAYLWVAASGYLLLGSIILSAWLVSRRSSEYSRRQGRILFYGSLLPMAGNLIYQFQPPAFNGMDWSSVFLSVSSILYLWALYGTHLLNLIPIAREKLIGSLSDGMIVLDTQGRIVDINQSAAQMFDRQPEKMFGKQLDEFLSLDPSHAGSRSEQENRTEIEIGLAEKRYFDVLVTPLFDNQTVFAGQLIIFRDMTNRKQNELRLLQLNRAVEQSPTSIVITDPDGNITYVNPRFSSLTGYSFEEMIGQNPRILKSGHTPPEIYTELWQTILSGKTWKGEFLNRKKNGDLYWEQATIAPVLDPDGRILNFIALKEEITQQKQLKADLELLATTDPLTGVINRRELIRRAEIELERARRYKHPTSIIMMDVDHFKNINDTYGHTTGDKVLVMLAQLLNREVRTSDLVARYGGEEFMLLLPETTLEMASNTAERIRCTVAETPLMADGLTISFTISLGVTSSESVGQDFESLLKEADRLMYQAKQSGRNRVAASPAGESP